MQKPSLRIERQLFRSGVTRLAGMDEVGRGALAGPVSVGVAVIVSTTSTAPKGLRDSKLMLADKRTAMIPKVRQWAESLAVGHASPQEIDAFGLTVGLRRAGWRALSQVGSVDHVLLDGNLDWLTRPTQTTLFDDDAENDITELADRLSVTTVVKGDQKCSAVAAASVVAKVTRDRMMVNLAQAHPGYGLETNKGYAAPDHLAAIRQVGLSRTHRQSWKIAAAAQPVSDTTIHKL
jgi:ribonuclease HII